MRKGELEFRAKQKVDDALTHLRGACGPRLTLILCVWDGVHTGDSLHNRYVLANHAGVAVQTGLDQNSSRPGHTDDVTILSAAQHNVRWSQYKPGSSAFRALIPPTTVAPAARAETASNRELPSVVASDTPRNRRE